MHKKTTVHILIIMDNATVFKIIAGKWSEILLPDADTATTTTTNTTAPEFAGDWGDPDVNGSITDVEPEFDGDWGDSDFHGSITDIEPEFAGDWGDSDFNGNESGPE